MRKGKVTLYLDLDALRALNKMAKSEDSSASRIIRRLVKEHIEKHARTAPKRKRNK